MNQISTQASSLIHINSASLGELQQLPGIGRALAQRIIDHREGRGPLIGQDHLYAIKGLGANQINKIVPLIDFSTPEDFAPIRHSNEGLTGWLISIVALVITGAMLHPMIELLVDELARWSPDLQHYIIASINSSAIVLTLSGMYLVHSWMMSLFYPGKNGSFSRSRHIRFSMAILLSSLALLILLTGLAHWHLRSRIDISLHLVNLSGLVAGIVLIIYLLYGPQLYYLSRKRFPPNLSGHFDISLVALILAVTLVRIKYDNQLVDLLLTCIGALFANLGYQLIQRRSAFVYLVRELPAWPNVPNNYPWIGYDLKFLEMRVERQRKVGWLFQLGGLIVLLASVAVSGYSTYRLLARFIPP